MFCTKCGAQIADGQRFCSRCGTPVDAAAPEENVPVWQPPVQETPPQEPAQEPAQTWEQPVYQQQTYQQPVYQQPEQPTRGKKARQPKAPKAPRAGKKNGALRWILCVVLVLAVAALVVMKLDTIKNFVDRTVSSPEVYYQHIETRAVGNYSDAIANRKGAFAAYGNMVNPEQKKTFAECEMTLSVNQKALGDEIMDLIADEAGIDLSWFESVGLYVSGGQKNDVIGGELIALLNDTEIVGANFCFDPESQTFYASVPELSGQYMAVSAEDLMYAGGYRYYGAASGAQTAEELMEVMPDEELLAKLIDRYSAIVINDLTKVEKGREKVTAGDVSATYTTLEVKLDAKVLMRIAKDVLTKMRDDRDVEDLICNFLAASGMSEDQVDQSFYGFLDWIDETLDSLEKTDPSEISTNILMTVYVDGAGNVRGRDIKIRRDKELKAEISYLLTVSGTKFGVKASYQQNDSYGQKGDSYYWEDEYLLSLSGSGSVNLKKEISGSFDVRYKMESDWNGSVDEMDLKVMKINVDAALKDEGVSFTIDVTPTKDLIELALEDANGMPTAIEDLIRSASLSIRGEVGEKTASLAYVLKNGKKDAITVSLNSSEIKAYDISLPANPVGPDEWAMGIDFSKISDIVSHLRDAGVPASLLEGLDYLF